MTVVSLTPIGRVLGGRTEVRDDDWGDVTSGIELSARFGPEALRGLEAFSHLEVVYLLDRVNEDRVEYAARRPRGREDWPEVGIFAQRGKNRPNRIGVSRCELLGISGLTSRCGAWTRSAGRRSSTSSRTCASSARGELSRSRPGRAS